MMSTSHHHNQHLIRKCLATALGRSPVGAPCFRTFCMPAMRSYHQFYARTLSASYPAALVQARSFNNFGAVFRPQSPFSVLGPVRSFFTLQMQGRTLAPTNCSHLVPTQQRDFSLKMRKVREKQKKVKKYKLKTKKAFAKRFRVCGSIRNKMFKHHALGYRHLNRNKSNRNLGKKRAILLTNKADVKKAKKFLPYFKRRKYLRC